MKSTQKNIKRLIGLLLRAIKKSKTESLTALLQECLEIVKDEQTKQADA